MKITDTHTVECCGLMRPFSNKRTAFQFLLHHIRRQHQDLWAILIDCSVEDESVAHHIEPGRDDIWGK